LPLWLKGRSRASDDTEGFRHRPYGTLSESRGEDA
jgi:hypothetical protein